VIEAPVASAWYVYGVVDARAPAAPAGVRLVDDGPVAAVVSAVPLADFGEDALAERLNDRDWLEEHARAHEDVLLRIADATTVVPFRFGVIYRDIDDVAAMLRERRDELVAALGRVRGHVELGVKAWADRARLEAALGDSAPADSSGRAYLERRRTEQQRAERAGALLAEIAADAHARLLAHAVEGVANRPQPRELSGRDETMILNGAYLAAAGGALRGVLGALEREHASRGITFELTGPWPPHNFVEPREDA
jgi:Gas vesicle synthesis protein GvpL/GvpF